nr:uncharacterized protein LOC108178710 [Oryctolagus cuniculus]
MYPGRRRPRRPPAFPQERERRGRQPDAVPWTLSPVAVPRTLSSFAVPPRYPPDAVLRMLSGTTAGPRAPRPALGLSPPSPGSASPTPAAPTATVPPPPRDSAASQLRPSPPPHCGCCGLAPPLSWPRPWTGDTRGGPGPALRHRPLKAPPTGPASPAQLRPWASPLLYSPAHGPRPQAPPTRQPLLRDPPTKPCPPGPPLLYSPAHGTRLASAAPPTGLAPPVQPRPWEQPCPPTQPRPQAPPRPQATPTGQPLPRGPPTEPRLPGLFWAEPEA